MDFKDRIKQAIANASQADPFQYDRGLLNPPQETRQPVPAHHPKRPKPKKKEQHKPRRKQSAPAQTPMQPNPWMYDHLWR